MQSEIKKLFDNMELLYENIYTLLEGFQKASTSEGSDIFVELKKVDGSVEKVSITSFQKIQQELTRIDNNYKSLINADNLSYTLLADGSISQQTKTSFINAEYLENFGMADECVVDQTSIVDDLVFPSVKIPVTIDSKLISDVHCKSFEISGGWETIGETPTILDLEYLQSQGKITYREVNRTLKLQKSQVQYFGKFTIESVTNIDNDFVLILNDIKYSSLNTIGNSIYLKVGDFMVSKSGASKFVINEIDKFSKTVKVSRIAGSEFLSVGIDAIYFNEKVNSSENIVGIPVKPTQKLVIFLSTENLKNISYPSKGIKIDTTDYKVVHQNKTYTLDEFFSSFVTNFSEYLLSFINETSIPINLGIKPNTPKLEATNFKVIQINKHLTSNKSINEIAELNKTKQSILNDIEYKQDQIDIIQQELSTQKFKSIDEKNSRLEKLQSYRNEINTMKANVLTVTRDIDKNATQSGLKSAKIKYRVIGFWAMQKPIYSPLTKLQNIIKYEVQYRYLSKDIDTVENTSYNMIGEDGKSVSVAFSSWIDLPTKTLNKVADGNGNLVWETPIMDSVEDININQLAISINEGESIEIKIRAVSEAGYPIAPLKSDFSESMRIEFPVELKQSNTNATVSQNTADLQKAEFESILNSLGLLGHVSGSIKESEKTFFHQAKDITSGQYTPEQKNIPMDVAISTLYKEIQSLKNANSVSNVDISLIDFNNESFAIKNNQTLELFAGNYTDSVNILEPTTYGSIIKKKGYIKIRNNNTVPVELKTLVPGSLALDGGNAGDYFDVPIKNKTGYVQNPKQILYFRNYDLMGNKGAAFQLVGQNLPDVITEPKSTDIDINIPETVRKYWAKNAGGLYKFQFLAGKVYSPNFVGFTVENPILSNPDISQPSIDAKNAEFARITKYTDLLKAKQIQPSILTSFGYDNNDVYAIGATTCGAFLYPVITNPATISVVGDSTTSTLIIPKESEILIPFIFEYRMTDRIGNIDGRNDADSNTPLEYSKKIGVDIYINSEVFKFDITVSAKLKSKIVAINSLNVSSVVSAFNAEGAAGMI